jgi:hypothetical protein
MILLIAAFVLGLILGSGATYLLLELKKIDFSKPHNDYD